MCQSGPKGSAEGARVVGFARGLPALQRVQEELGSDAFLPVSVDIRDPNAIEAGVDKVVLTGSLATGRAVLRQLAEPVCGYVADNAGQLFFDIRSRE